MIKNAAWRGEAWLGVVRHGGANMAMFPSDWKPLPPLQPKKPKDGE